MERSPSPTTASVRDPYASSVPVPAGLREGGREREEAIAVGKEQIRTAGEKSGAVRGTRCSREGHSGPEEDGHDEVAGRSGTRRQDRCALGWTRRVSGSSRIVSG